MIQKYAPSDFRRMAWKNGGGETIEVAIDPADATLDTFDWRISMARVATSGPFSAFVGIDRTLAVLSGRGLRLTAQNAGSGHQVVLEPHGEPHRFAGDAPVHADLIGDEPTLDFNVMTRRDRFEHAVGRVILSGATRVVADTVVLFCVDGQVDCREGDAPASAAVSLSTGEALVARIPGAGRSGATSVWIEERNASPAHLLVVQLNSRMQLHG
jgi:environmental stress-induced protein Ves